MKIIIDVPNESYAWIKEHTSVRDYSSTTEFVLCDAIRNGVPYEERPTGEGQKWRRHTMTNEEAIEILKTESCADCSCHPVSPMSCINTKCPLIEATLLAIKALEERPTEMTEEQNNGT